MLNCFSVFDKKAEAFLTPFFLPTQGVAERSFQQCIEDQNHQFSLNPEDYILYHHGEFNIHTGVFVPLDHPEPILDGITCYKAIPKEKHELHRLRTAEIMRREEQNERMRKHRKKKKEKKNEKE